MDSHPSDTDLLYEFTRSTHPIGLPSHDAGEYRNRMRPTICACVSYIHSRLSSLHVTNLWSELSRYGIFRLTNPPGLDHILKCTQTATFHQHSIDGLYTDATHPPGHVYESAQLDFQIEDLRTTHTT